MQMEKESLWCVGVIVLKEHFNLFQLRLLGLKQN